MEYVDFHNNVGKVVRVSRLGLGCEPLGGFDWGCVDVPDIERGVCDALDHGLTYFDTAAAYGLGLSEERLGKILGSRRNEVVIATKAGISWRGPERNGVRARTKIDGSPTAIRSSVEGSLKRLKVETVPLLFLHYPDPLVPVEESIGAILDLQHEGKILAIGVSNFSAEQLDRANRVARISAVQLECSILNLAGKVDHEAARKWCISRKIPLVAYGVLARGLLAGKFGPNLPKFHETDRRSRLPEFQPENFRRYSAVISQLSEHASGLGVPTAAIAIRWVLDVLGIDVAITGIKSRAHIEENLRAMDWVLPVPTIRSISAILGLFLTSPAA